MSRWHTEPMTSCVAQNLLHTAEILITTIITRYPSIAIVQHWRGQSEDASRHRLSYLAQACCAALQIDEALRMHTSDNVSVVTVCFSGKPPPPRRTRGGGVSRTVSKDGLNMLSEALPGLISQPSLMRL